MSDTHEQGWPPLADEPDAEPSHEGAEGDAPEEENDNGT